MHELRWRSGLKRGLIQISATFAFVKISEFPILANGTEGKILSPVVQASPIITQSDVRQMNSKHIADITNFVHSLIKVPPQVDYDRKQIKWTRRKSRRLEAPLVTPIPVFSKDY